MAILDYGMGNLFSVQHACHAVGMDSRLVTTPEEVASASALILPGIGAFGDAAEILRSTGTFEALAQAARQGKPILGICLGLQLLAERSSEFGSHQGLGLIRGEVVHFGGPKVGKRLLKVPQVGWNRLERSVECASWEGALLEGVPEGAFMYFVHSYHLRVGERGVEVASARYGDVTFTAMVRKNNVFACQFHPERSGPLGLRIYGNFKKYLERQ